MNVGNWFLGAALVITFTVITWNLVLPLSSAQNSEFWFYSRHVLTNMYERNEYVQQHIEKPLVEPLLGMLQNQMLFSTTTAAAPQTSSSSSLSSPLSEGNNNSNHAEVGREDNNNDNGNDKSIVTLTFYVEYGSHRYVTSLLDMLDKYDIEKAVFFVHEEYANDHPYVILTMKDMGYVIYPWQRLTYDSIYPPSTYQGTTLAGKELLKNIDKDSEAAEFLNKAISSRESAIVAFDPKVMNHPLMLEELLKQSNKSITFVDYNMTRMAMEGLIEE